MRYLSHTKKKSQTFDRRDFYSKSENIMSHKKPQRLLTIDQIVKRQLLEKLQSVFLGLIIFTLIGGVAYAAFYQG